MIDTDDPSAEKFSSPEHAYVSGLVMMFMSMNDMEVIPLLDSESNFSPEMVLRLPAVFEDAEQLEVKVRVIWDADQ